jgi:Xaa-Pro dipeptidase
MMQQWDGVGQDPAFSSDEFQRRAAAVREGMRRAGIDLLLVSDFSNLYYLAGMDSIAQHDFQCLILPADGEPRLVANEFYEGVHHHSACIYPPLFYNEFEDPIRRVMDGIRQVAPTAKTVAVEHAWPSLSERIADGLQQILPGVAVRDSAGAVEAARLVKSDAELALMRRAAQLTEAGVVAAAEVLRPGRVDREAAAAATAAMLRAGGDCVPLGPIVCGGYRGGIPYSTFNGYTLREGDAVFLELTGSLRRYVAPLMRSFVLGEPDAEIERVARATSRAVDTIMATARDGIEAKAVAEAAMECLADGLPGHLFHNIIGYPVGIAFPPTWVERLGHSIKTNSKLTLRSGMVFHLPMSLRKLGRYAVGLSQTIVVGPAGATGLTTSPARLQVL